MKYISYFLILLIGLLLISGVDDRLYQISKNFEIYGAIFRELNESYVIEVDPDQIMEDGINGMLKKLDPYTEFYPEDDQDKINVVTDGQYVGFGITISRIKNEIYVSDFAEDFLAFDSGLRVGDKIYKIDGTVVINKSSDELKEFTQGKINSLADVSVIRQSDTLNLKLERHKVDVQNISYYGALKDSIGYIKLDRFSKDSDEDFKNAFLELKNRKKIKGLIIDLRDNPGGLLQSAFGICEMFLPTGSLIVSTKGRKFSKNYEYKSRTKPIDTEIPLAVLINEGSASASEIVAGCIQDHDRGVVLGQTSFGKGLVQTVANLPHKTKLKLTTARYYTPSGRSIQGIDYYKAFNKDTSVFYTDGGRQVNEHRGIEPDSIFSEKDYSDFVTNIYNQNYFFKFGNYFSYQKNFPISYQVSEDDLKQFKDFLIDEGYVFSTKASKKIDDLYILAEEEKVDPQLVGLLDSLNKLFKKDINKLFDKDQKDIALLLRFELLRRFHNSNELTDVFKDSDSLILGANKILNGKTYLKILVNSSELKEKH